MEDKPNAWQAYAAWCAARKEAKRIRGDWMARFPQGRQSPQHEINEGNREEA